MANRDFEIEMKLKADFAAAQRESEQTTADIEGITDAAGKANTALSKTSGGQGQSNRIREMVQRSLAELEAAQAQIEAESAGSTSGRAEATEQLTAAQQAQLQAMRASQQAIAAEIGLIGDLQSRLARGASSMDDLADTEARLDTAMSKGLITVDEYQEALDKLNNEQVRLEVANEKSDKSLTTVVGRYDKATAGLQRLAADEARLKQAVDAGRISREQYNKAMATLSTERVRLTNLRNGAEQAAGSMRKLNLQSAETQRNLSQLVTYGVTGNWQLAGNQVMQLGNQVGIASRLFSAAGLAVGGFATAVGGAAAIVVTGELRIRAINEALIRTGNIAGVTAGQVSEMSTAVGDATGKYGKAQQAMQGLLDSGRYTGEGLESAARAAVSLSEMTGKSIDDATRQIIALADAPKETLQALDKQYNLLTYDVYEHIKSLDRQGLSQEASKARTEALADALDRRTDEMRQNLTRIERWWDDVASATGRALDAAKKYFDDSYENQLRLAQLDLRVSLWASDGQETDRTRQLRERVEWLEKQKEAQDASNQAKAEEGRLNRNAKAASDRIDGYIARIDKQAERQQRLNKLVEDYNAIAVADPNDVRLYDGSYDRLKKQIEKDTAAPKADKTTAQQAEEAARRELDNLAKQAALLQTLGDETDKVSEAERIRYEITEGTYRNASAGLKEQLEDYAQLLDSERGLREEKKKQQEEYKKTQQAYEQLLDSLRTPAEVALDTAIERVDTLNKALQAGIADAGSYQANVGKIVGAAFEKPPTFNGLAPEVGGANSEQQRLNDSRAQLEKWYADQLALLNQFREQKIGDEASWNAQEVALAQQHAEQLARLQQAQSQLNLSQAESMFGSLADIAKTYGGEQSKTYQALFAISKGFAVAQAAVALAQNVAEASKVGYPQNIPMIASAFAQGAQIASLLAAANYSAQTYAGGGHVRGAGTGTSDSINARLSDYEFVTRSAVVRQPGALPFLEDFNDRGMPALYEWARTAELAGGGLFTAAATEQARDREQPSTPWAEAQRNQQVAVEPTSVQNRLRLYNLFDMDALAERLASHPVMEKRIVVVAGENGSAIKASW